MKEERRRRSFPAGHDDENPYDNIDVSTLPQWWQEEVEEFENHGMRPYRPPRFSDGEIVTPTMEEIEANLNVDIRIRARNPSIGDDWELLVDGDGIARVGRHRSSEGYTVYELTVEEFRNLVRDSINDSS